LLADVRQWSNGKADGAGTLKVLVQQHTHGRPVLDITL
jgi:hypothetical protein